MKSFLLYIDPGTGSLIFQAILSGLLTVIIFFKRIVSFVKFIFKGNVKSKNGSYKNTKE